MSETATLASKAIVDFDHHSPAYPRNWQAICRDLQTNTPVAWTEAHGGYWILTSYDDCRAAAGDWKTFSSENDVLGKGNGAKGIMIPQNPFQFALSESDPPQATTIRKIEFPYFTMSNVAKWESVARQNATDALNAVAATGTIDFATQLALTVPAKTVMALAGVPLTDWEMFAMSAHKMSYMPASDPDFPHAEIAHVQQMILDLVRLRRTDPRDDIVSALTSGTINGEPLSDEMAVGALSAAVFAGFDTVAATTLDLLLYLNDKPELRARVLADPASMAAAIEETLRLTPPGHFLARTVMRDVVLKGQQLRAGDRVLMVWAAANRDPAVFERPDEFWLERPNAAQHLTFSFGPHRCLGSILGKMEIRVMVQEVLTRIGDYQIDPAKVVRYDSYGTVAGYKSMPARFIPWP